jgi:hypothetical protein
LTAKDCEEIMRGKVKRKECCQCFFQLKLFDVGVRMLVLTRRSSPCRLSLSRTSFVFPPPTTTTTTEYSEEKKTADPSDNNDYVWNGGAVCPNTPKIQNTRKSKPQYAIERNMPSLAPPPAPTAPPRAKSSTTSSTLRRTPTSSNKSSNSKSHHGGRRGRSIMATILLDLPLFTILAAYAIIAWIHYVQDQYLEPQVKAALIDDERRARDITYYMRQCDIRDLSTTNGADLFIDRNASADEAYEHQMTHGFTVFRSVLQESTATHLRNYALQRNRNLTVQDSIYVIENERRWSFGLGTDEPSVTNAITELTSHAQLNDAVEKICKWCCVFKMKNHHMRTLPPQQQTARTTNRHSLTKSLLLSVDVSQWASNRR